MVIKQLNRQSRRNTAFLFSIEKDFLGGGIDKIVCLELVDGNVTL